MAKKEVSITFRTSKELKEQIVKLSELETRKMSQTIEHYLRPVINARLKELEQE